MNPNPILILDFGSQTTQLIARRVREHAALSEIVPHTISAEALRRKEPRGLILSGGPASCYVEGAPAVDPEVFDLGVPVLGICYGMQVMTRALGGGVAHSDAHEYGATGARFDRTSPLFARLAGDASTVWMSHGDRVHEAPKGFRAIATTTDCAAAAIAHDTRPLYGVQFHPEVSHTEAGSAILEGFLRGVCRDPGEWSPKGIVERLIEAVREQIEGRGQVICGLSGGVDSAVVAALLDRAIGDKLTCIFVDNGLLRSGEREHVEAAFRPLLGDRLRIVDARARFLDALGGVTDPEKKRIAIGHTFIDAFKAAAIDIPDANFLAQGTLYPDVVESISPHGGPTAKIKSHHNVGGLPKDLGFELCEPLRLLFKDEVRRIGIELGLAEAIVYRHPFPGPGLAVRILGEVTEERIEIVRAGDAIVREEVERAGLHRSLWQAFCVLLPVKTVGVMGDARTYEYACVIRCVESEDGMTADWARLPYDVLARMSSRIVNEVKGINRVTYDVTQKPPGTIEWE